jgi:hypothetical protein
MAQDSTTVRVAPNGHVSIANYPAILPTTVTVALDTGFKELGYLDDSGASITPSVDTNGIKAWQAATDVKTVLTSVNLDVKFQMIQVTQDTTANFFFGATWANVINTATLTMSSNPSLAFKAMVVEWTDDQNYIYRLVCNRGILTDRDALTLKRSDAVAFGVTFHLLDDSGTLCKLLTNNPNILSGT